MNEPPQRRDNGLRADQFIALADVDPRLGEHLLDLLRLAEIPAYLEPSTDPRVSVRYRVSGPVERLYVQADQRQEARAVVVAAAHEAGEEAIPETPWPDPEPPSTGVTHASAGGADLLAGIDTDAEFARIVSGFAAPSADRAGMEPPEIVLNQGHQDPSDLVVDHGPDGSVIDAKLGPAHLDPAALDPAALDRADLDPAALDRADLDPAALDPADLDPAALDEAAERHARERREVEAAAALAADDLSDDEDHFHPPPAPPFPVPTANTVGAVLLLLLGLVVLIRGDVFGLGSEASFPVGIVLLLVASALIIRGLRDQPEPGEEPEDDGAAV